MSEDGKARMRSRMLMILKRIGTVILVLYLCLCLLAFFLAGSLGELGIPFRLALGWIPYLFDVVPKTQLNLELLLSSLGALLLAATGLQFFMSRLFASGRWPWRWTLMWCGLLIVMFGTSIAAVGVVHQTGWLFRLPSWSDWRGRGLRTSRAKMNALQVMIAARTHAGNHGGKFPDTSAEFKEMTDPRFFWVAMDSQDVLEPLVYAGAGLNDHDPGDLPVVWSPRPNTDGWRVVARLDGITETMHEDKFQEVLTKLREHLAKQADASKGP